MLDLIKDVTTIELCDKTKVRGKLLEWLKEQSDNSDTSVNINFDIPKKNGNAGKSYATNMQDE